MNNPEALEDLLTPSQRAREAARQRARDVAEGKIYEVVDGSNIFKVLKSRLTLTEARAFRNASSHYVEIFDDEGNSIN